MKLMISGVSIKLAPCLYCFEKSFFSLKLNLLSIRASKYNKGDSKYEVPLSLAFELAEIL